MKLVLKVMVVLYKVLPHPKGEMLAWALSTKYDLTRVTMYGKAHHSQHVTYKSNKKVP